ncbi:MAG: hypothetical protein GY757_06145 [bacterium]|nr:hypothetical protein [bacterium]
MLQGDFIQVKEITNVDKAQILIKFLGKGEVESIVLAEEMEASLLIIDDKKGGNYADSFGIKTIGIVGLLLKAHHYGLLNNIEEELVKLKEAGFRIKESFLQFLTQSVFPNSRAGTFILSFKVQSSRLYHSSLNVSTGLALAAFTV